MEIGELFAEKGEPLDKIDRRRTTRDRGSPAGRASSGWCLFWVKMRRTHGEQIQSAIPDKRTYITGRYFAEGPATEVDGSVLPT